MVQKIHKNATQLFLLLSHMQSLAIDKFPQINYYQAEPDPEGLSVEHMFYLLRLITDEHLKEGFTEKLNRLLGWQQALGAIHGIWTLRDCRDWNGKYLSIAGVTTTISETSNDPPIPTI